MNLKFKIPNVKLKDGQIMVEAIVALSMLTMGMVGIFTLLSNSYGFNRISTNEYVAVNLASEGIEIVRDIIDTNILNLRSWNCGVSTNGNFQADYNDSALAAYSASDLVKFDNNLKVYTYDSSADTVITPFNRRISIQNLGTPVSEIRVISRVTWKDRGSVPYDVTLEDRLFSWRGGTGNAPCV